MADPPAGSKANATLSDDTRRSRDPQLDFLAGLGAVMNPDGTTSVKFRFSNPGTAAWKIDDVYVDPWKLK